MFIKIDRRTDHLIVSSLQMKSLVRNTLIFSVALFLSAYILPALSVTGGLPTYIIGGFFLMLLTLVLKPILSIISFPINLLTLGMFSIVINVIILYLLTLFISNITIQSFIFQGYSLAGFIIPRVYVNIFFAFVVTSAIISFIVGGITWLIK